MAFNIATRFRGITKQSNVSITETEMTADYITPALARFNSIMGTALTLTTGSTGNSVADEAVAWLAASMYMAGDYTTKRDENRGGLFIWEVWEQQAYKVMCEIDATKIVFNKGTGIYTVKMREEVWTNSMSYRDDTGDTVFGA